MIVLKENERHHATSWQYNSARILTRLAQLITAQGGKVRPLPLAILSDRNLEEICTATQRRLESSYNAGPTSPPQRAGNADLQPPKGTCSLPVHPKRSHHRHPHQLYQLRNERRLLLL